MNDRLEGYQYPPYVKYEINQNQLDDYHLAAEFLNMREVDVVCLQHEYGIFGPDGSTDGRYIVELMQRLHASVVTTLHTVLRAPDEGQRKTLTRIAELSDRCVVMANRAAQFLRDDYGVPSAKIIHIPHGIPDTPFVDPTYYKDKFDVAGKKVILTFGLLSPSKGIEAMIDALPLVAHAHPDVVYLILGATHPKVKVIHDEDYRARLERRAREQNVGDRVIFHNQFIELPELCEYLSMADVYLTPYLNEAQIVSGTLAYALGTGNAVVSTSYWYAQEMLADGRGRLVPFRDVQAVATTIIDLFDNETERHAMRKRAYDFSRGMIWPEVARQYLDLFTEIKDDRCRAPQPLSSATSPSEDGPKPARVKLDHLRMLTDDTGILQHARGAIPHRDEGYCTDDNARALITVLMAYDNLPDGKSCGALVSRYLSFLEHAFDRDTGGFRNFLSYDRRWLEPAGSEDSHGRAVWALGATVAHRKMRACQDVAIDLFRKALPAVVKFEHPRAWAYALLGIAAYLHRYGGDSGVRRVREVLGLRLMDQFSRHATDDWPWPADCLTYANARLPHALLVTGRSLSNQEMIDTALRSLDWLVEIQTAEQGHFSPIGNNGWYHRKDGAPARFDQQPVEAATTIDACLEAAGATDDDGWVRHADRCLNWFLGDNDLHVHLYDSTTGGCRDGLGPQGASTNQGAESTLAWLMAALAALALHAHERDASPAAAEPVKRELQATS